MWYLSFTTWLISLSIMLSSSTHAVEKGMSSFFFSAVFHFWKSNKFPGNGNQSEPRAACDMEGEQQHLRKTITIIMKAILRIGVGWQHLYMKWNATYAVQGNIWKIFCLLPPFLPSFPALIFLFGYMRLHILNWSTWNLPWCNFLQFLGQNSKKEIA